MKRYLGAQHRCNTWSTLLVNLLTTMRMGTAWPSGNHIVLLVSIHVEPLRLSQHRNCFNWSESKAEIIHCHQTQLTSDSLRPSRLLGYPLGSLGLTERLGSVVVLQNWRHWLVHLWDNFAREIAATHRTWRLSMAIFCSCQDTIHFEARIFQHHWHHLSPN